jgi:hypothetical protein
MSAPSRHIVAITASGPVGCGKSAVLGEIEIALRAIGLDVVWVGGDQEKRLTHADWQHDLDMYRPRVVLTEIVNGNCDCPGGWEKQCILASCSRKGNRL